MKEKEFYRNEIIKMVEKINDSSYLKFIYDLLKSIKKKWGI